MLTRRLLLGSVVATSVASTSSAKDASPLATLLPPLMSGHGVTAVSAAVIDEGRIADTAAIGAPASALFQAASISKIVTGLVTLRLWERRELDLDVSVNNQLRTWRLQGQEAEKVTPRLLLCHRAGTNVSGFAGYAPETPLPTLLQTLDGTTPANNVAVAVTSPPGKAFRYSGGGTTVLQRLIEDVRGQPFDSVARDLVLSPVRMSRSIYSAPLPDTAAAATGHDEQGIALPGRWKAYPEFAAAGLWSTAQDLAGLALAIARGWLSGDIVSRDTARLMATAVDGGPTGLGVFVTDRPGLSPYLYHYGSNAGFNSLLLVTADGLFGCTVMTNGDSGRRLIRDLVIALTEDRGLAPFERRR